MGESNKKSHFVLVHGLGAGAWSWFKMRALLEQSGYTVTCIELTGAGIDMTNPISVLTFDHYNKPLLDFLDALPNGENVILVGVSAAGLNLTHATHLLPNKLVTVVYVAATMLKFGFTSEQDYKDAMPQNFTEDMCEYEYGLGRQNPPTTVYLKKEFLRKLYLNKTSEENKILCEMLVRPGPVYCLTNARFDKIAIEKDDIDNVPRVFVRSRHDLVLKPKQQEAMIKRWPPKEVYELDSDHNPLFSAPSALLDVLIKVATSIN